MNWRWKIPIISSIWHYNKRRFSDILNDIEGISNRMLSKELKELEINQLVKRTVLDTQPITVQYELTEHGKAGNKYITPEEPQAGIIRWAFEQLAEAVYNTEQVYKMAREKGFKGTKSLF